MIEAAERVLGKSYSRRNIRLELILLWLTLLKLEVILMVVVVVLQKQLYKIVMF